MSIANKVSGQNRKNKFDRFMRMFNVTPKTTILDLGYTDIEYTPHENYLEKNYPYTENITALGIVEPKQFSTRYPMIKTMVYDGKAFPFEDKSFDICWSNAVIEHVGYRDSQLLFLQEIKRVAKSAYVTTPNRLFPIEVHTKLPLLHLLPKRQFDSILRALGKGWATGTHMNLLFKKDIVSLLEDAEIKNYTIYSNRFFGFTVDYAVSMFFE